MSRSVLARKAISALVVFLVCAPLFFAQSSKPITFKGLRDALNTHGLSNEELTQIVKSRGVNFELTPPVESELRAAGADSSLLAAVRASYHGSPRMAIDETKGESRHAQDDAGTSSESPTSDGQSRKQVVASDGFVTRTWMNLRDGQIYRTRLKGDTLYVESVDNSLNRAAEITGCEFRRAVSIGLGWMGTCWERNPKDRSTYQSRATLNTVSEARIEGSTEQIPKFVLVPISNASGATPNHLFIDTEPSGADVFINGIKQAGQTPVVLSLAPGEYDVVLRLEGYDPYAVRAQVNDIPTRLLVKLNHRLSRP